MKSRTNAQSYDWQQRLPHKMPNFKLREITSCLAVLYLTGCGNSVSGVYECKRNVESHTHFGGGSVVLARTFTYDLRSDGSFLWTYDPGQDTEGHTDSNREVTQGKWEYTGGRIVCYSGDGAIFGELTKEGNDLINKEGARYRRL